MILFIFLMFVSLALISAGCIYNHIMSFVGITMFFLSFIICPIQINSMYVKSKTEIPLIEIKQEIDGTYFIVDKEYNKIYPNVKIVKTNPKYVEIVEGYKFLDWTTPDYISYILYLNLNDVSK